MRLSLNRKGQRPETITAWGASPRSGRHKAQGLKARPIATGRNRLSGRGSPGIASLLTSPSKRAYRERG